MTGPLDGIRIIEIANVVAGPSAAAQLADQGADVIKIEPPSGDIIRKSSKTGLPPTFISCNRGKRSLTLDLKQDAAHEILWKLIEKADVLIQNLRPGAMERLGFSGQHIQKRNPRLIYLSISGFGETGPYSKKRVYDPLVQAVAGFADIQGEGIHPKMIRTIIADKTTAAYSAQAVTAALFNREKTGQGQQIKISMLDAMISMLWPEGMAPFTIIADNNVIPPPSHDKIFKTSDGYITTGAVSDSEWQGMCKALEHPEWLDDPRFATQQLRNTNKDTRYELMASALETDTSDKWLAALDRHDVPCAPVLQRAQLFDNPQIINNEIISELEQPGVGPIRQARPAARFSKTPAEKPRPAPELGQHNNEILSELGFTQAEIDNLSETKIIG